MVGRSVTFTGEAWTFALGTSHFGLGWSYHRPKRVVVEGPSLNTTSMPIRDHVMLVRMAGFFLIALVLLSRRRRA